MIKLIILITLFLFSCKDKEKINLESAIDEYLFMDKVYVDENNIEKIKSKFENIKIEKLNVQEQVSKFYYLSKLSLHQSKYSEAYNCIVKAYEISKADSIFTLKAKIQDKLANQREMIIDSSKTNLVWFNDTENKLMMFDINKIDYSTSPEPQVSDKGVNIQKIVLNARSEIQELFKNDKINSAISKCEMLINVLLQLNKDKQINVELSQLYQDLAILYAKNNQTDKALSSILKAIDLNPENKKNKEIKALLN
tara:strand:- start:55923 stop:56681 length:759 start_codon:yes stop_codon:yes gene_type:complete